MTVSYNYYMVALSFLIAILASYSALSIASRISNAEGKMRFFWLFSGSFVMGTGVWSMHFVGMLALHANMAVAYDTKLTFISLFASVIASFIAFLITMPKQIKWNHIAFGGLFMGSGIVAMHYLGMEAMVMEAEVSYHPFYWTLSVVVAIVASYVSLLLFIKFRNYTSSSLLKIFSAIFMGIAITGMHYIGMRATIFDVPSGAEMVHNSAKSMFLVYSVTGNIAIILLISWGSIFFDRHVLEKMAYRDSITNLPNRHEMTRFFNKAVEKEQLSVMFLDLDHFKVINDTLGHDIGDSLIEEVGKRLNQFISEDVKVFRIGGDEFLIIVKQHDRQTAETLAKEILSSLKKVYDIKGNTLYITGSIGISIGVIHDEDRTFLLRAADTAMYKAKALGKNQYCVYNEKMGKQEVRKMEIEKDLQRAIDEKQFYVVYQPKWNVTRNQLCGFEALVRWDHPHLGLISPVEFIPVAEEKGLIVQLTNLVLEEACYQCKQWQQRGIIQPVSVNMSVVLFRNGNLFETIQRVLKATGLEPHLLELEITESMVLEDINNINQQLNMIRSIGVRVSLDDFGTGYSSIGLLDQIPIDALKLDRLFTNDLDTPSKRAIINAIILMADSLKIDVIAEGVENEDHTESLKELGCQVMQGFYYGKPMKDRDIDNWISNSLVVE
ncbi:bifunctional diguanylate cyclase/phosphodiesterase [Ornithinibacillus halotolerans]|uniref:Signaling protein n=1 Tax=Ornithinibacillus halotolerans TaxID=1274357 RepID=A0A916RLY0_9BACI|nr:bifunctional diguanylate cyclase/phosphodiesterase [Ornithinibacillus halotolerans]GGA60211.1 putative signaling protein [Ornithinibacillus halotolerans]